MESLKNINCLKEILLALIIMLLCSCKPVVVISIGDIIGWIFIGSILLFFILGWIYQGLKKFFTRKK